MAIPLRIFPAGPAGTTAEKPPAPARAPEPMPIQYILIGQDGLEGPHTDVVRLWLNEDAARCRACEPGACNFVPSEQGFGMCRTRRPGDLSPGFPLPG